MKSLLAAMLGCAVLATSIPEPSIGLITYYNPGIMELVYRNRLAAGQVHPCEECVGYAALLDFDSLDEHIWILKDGVLWGPLLVVDCAPTEGPALQYLLDRGWIAEVDFETAMAMQLTGPEVGMVFPDLPPLQTAQTVVE